MKIRNIMNFKQLFKEIFSEEISENVFGGLFIEKYHALRWDVVDIEVNQLHFIDYHGNLKFTALDLNSSYALRCSSLSSLEMGFGVFILSSKRIASLPYSIGVGLIGRAIMMILFLNNAAKVQIKIQN